MARITHKEYSDYLQKRSLWGDIYRKYYLYPILCRHLSGKVLDVGCGIGDFLRYYPNAVGLDINSHNIRYCKNKGLSAFLIENSLFPFPDLSFNGVVLDNVLEHLEDPSMTISEIHRVLNKNGALIVGVPGPAGYNSDPDHKQFYDQDSLAGLFFNYGFKMTKVMDLPFRMHYAKKRLRQYCIYAIFNKS